MAHISMQISDVYKNPRLIDLAKLLRTADMASECVSNGDSENDVEETMDAMLQEFRQLVRRIPTSTDRQKKT